MVLYWYLRGHVIGTVVHELAHALTVYLCGSHVDELDITSHVNHHGQYNLGHQMAISYAPLVVNTTLAVFFAQWAQMMPHRFGTTVHRIDERLSRRRQIRTRDSIAADQAFRMQPPC